MDHEVKDRIQLIQVEVTPQRDDCSKFIQIPLKGVRSANNVHSPNSTIRTSFKIAPLKALFLAPKPKKQNFALRKPTRTIIYCPSVKDIYQL